MSPLDHEQLEGLVSRIPPPKPTFLVNSLLTIVYSALFASFLRLARAMTFSLSVTV